ncbi:MAG: coproporphyrinogen III oxidase, partial [Akkermansia sp.]
MQSLDSGILRLLGREHTPAQALHSVEMLKMREWPISTWISCSPFRGNLSIWEATLKEAVRAGTDHISAYNLTYEEDTEFFRSLSRGEKIQDPDEDAAYFELAENILEATGMRHYETSNYAREGARSPHNMAYWKGEDYVGIGPGAVSTIDGVRYSNT